MEDALAPEEALYQSSLMHLRAPRPAQTGSFWFLLLFILFLLGGIQELKSFSGVVILLGVLLFHEGGHALGMRLFKFRDVRMFFIPLFGAAVSGRARGAAAWKEALVSLLGPLPGILAGFGAIFLLGR